MPYLPVLELLIEMKGLFYTFSVIFTCAVCFLALIVTLFNTYLFIRRRFPVKVNCWFCNTWTKVEYDNQNSFECPTCLQYNGFTKDGGYNRIIPEHHDEHLNQKPAAFIQNRSPQRNSNKSLCATCNHNQRLKVFQLANFVPLVEKNYDVEIEHFQKQLEKAYRLCKRCEEVLQITLQAQNLKIISNRVRQLKKETASLLDLSKPYRGTAKKPIFIKFVHYSIILFAGLIFVNTLVTFDYSDEHLRKLLPHFLLNTAKKTKLIFSRMLKTTDHLQMEMEPILQTMSEQCTKFSEEVEKMSTNFWDTINEHHIIKHSLQLVTEKIPSFPINVKIERDIINYTFTTIGGLLLQLILCFWNKGAAVTKASQIICWVLLTVIPFNEKYELFQLFLKVFCPLFILYTMTFPREMPRLQKKPKKRKNIRRLAKDYDVFSDFSDNENFTEHRDREQSFDSTKTAQIQCDRSLNTSTHSTAKRNNSFSLESDLNASLSNLALGNSHSGFSTDIPKPLLSPSKLSNVTKNPWTAGGFWSNPYICPSPEPTACNLSTSSSHSSGFGSHTNENLNFSLLPASTRNSVSGGDDRLSVFSEPPYHFSNTQFELYKAKNGAMTAAVYAPNSGIFGMQNFLQQPVWSGRGKEPDGFSSISNMVNVNWPHSYVRGSLFKNIGNQNNADSFSRIRD